MLSQNNWKHVHSILAYFQLEANWDSYRANLPSKTAIGKANHFIVNVLSPQQLDVFFTTPTPDGNILVELKNEACHLEFIFSEDVAEEKILASIKGEHHAEYPLDANSLFSCLNWLYAK